MLHGALTKKKLELLILLEQKNEEKTPHIYTGIRPCKLPTPYCPIVLIMLDHKGIITLNQEEQSN